MSLAGTEIIAVTFSRGPRAVTRTDSDWLLCILDRLKIIYIHLDLGANVDTDDADLVAALANAGYLPKDYSGAYELPIMLVDGVRIGSVQYLQMLIDNLIVAGVFTGQRCPRCFVPREANALNCSSCSVPFNSIVDQAKVEEGKIRQRVYGTYITGEDGFQTAIAPPLESLENYDYTQFIEAPPFGEIEADPEPW